MRVISSYLSYRTLDRGHEVYTPTLTGLGERVHLAAKGIELDTHIMDVVNVIRYENLDDVILVGHSYGGIVITGVAEAIPERLRRLVYLDASTPKNGQSGLDTLERGIREHFEDRARKDGFFRWADFSDPDQPFGVTNPSDIAWIKVKMTPHPIKTIQQAVKFAKSSALAIPKVYIRCTKNPHRPSEVSNDTAGWEYYEMDAAHDVMVTKPEELAILLNKII